MIPEIKWKWSRGFVLEIRFRHIDEEDIVKKLGFSSKKPINTFWRFSMKRMRLALVAFLGLCVVLMGSVTYATAEDYEVTFTNLTQGQVVTPPVVFSHTGLFSLFAAGEPAKAVVAQLAEAGNSAPLVASLMTFPPVFDVESATQPILPGESLTLMVSTSDSMNRITALGMLAQTNDCFFGVNGVMAPAEGMIVVYANAWDAGSEANNELSSHVPGPPFGGHMRDIQDAEGFVHIHPGIHGVGDLDAAMYDWKNPVVMVTIKLVQ
jgi:hypothetical protein